MVQCWEVVGGSDTGGIVVREDKTLLSQQLAHKLATGSIVEEMEIVGDRLRYKRGSGAGPDTGWVSISVKDKPLLSKVVAAAAPAPADDEALMAQLEQQLAELRRRKDDGEHFEQQLHATRQRIVEAHERALEVARRHEAEAKVTFEVARRNLLAASKDVETAESELAKLQQLSSAESGGQAAALQPAQRPFQLGQPGAEIGGPAGRSSGKGGQEGCLRPSLRGTSAMRRAMEVQRSADEVSADLQVVQEFQESEAITCVAFSEERRHRSYIVMAAGTKDAFVVLYHCPRTEMELAMLSEQDDPLPGPDAAGSAHPTHIHKHGYLVGHSRAITSICFHPLEALLVTSSIDKSVRWWSTDSLEMLVFCTFSCPVPVALFLPFNPQVLVVAESDARLVLLNGADATHLQVLGVEAEARALTFDDSGMFLLAGTTSGSIQVLECVESSSLQTRFKVQVAQAVVTCIRYVPARDGEPPCLLVNTADSHSTIIEMTYTPRAEWLGEGRPPADVLTGLAVRHRVQVQHTVLPLLKCTYSPSGQGYLISASEDTGIYIFALGRGQNYKMQWLKHGHSVPVVAVAVNLQDTLLASGDCLGHVVMWRRMDFSHLPE